MSAQTKTLITLLVLAPVLTEIVSGNTPAHALLDPRVDFFMLVAYSLPLLVIREFALRLRLALPGVFALGLAYGIWNEGLLAQTLMRYEHVPIGNFDHYLCAARFNFSWAGLIVPWHALLAVILPLALVGGLFPACAQSRLLGRRAFAALTAILAALILFVSVVRKPHPQMLACLAAISGLVLLLYLSRRWVQPESAGNPRRGVPFVFGGLAYPIFILSAIALASNRVPAWAYFAVISAILAGLAVLCYRFHLLVAPAAAPLALGTYFAASSFTMASGIAHHSLERILTGALLAGVFAFLACAALPSDSFTRAR
jgi:hypothetical protein